MGRGSAMVLVGGLLLSGCGSDALNASYEDKDAHCAVSTLSFTVTPAVLSRGDSVTVDLRWETDTSLITPVHATLFAGADDEIEVEMPLSESTTAAIWVGSVMNPYGAGAPAGDAWILAESAAPSGCLAAPNATASFTLQ